MPRLRASPAFIELRVQGSGFGVQGAGLQALHREGAQVECVPCTVVQLVVHFVVELYGCTGVQLYMCTVVQVCRCTVVQ